MYSREISRERPRVSLLYHMSVNQRLIANIVNRLLHRNLSEIWPIENNEKKKDQ